MCVHYWLCSLHHLGIPSVSQTSPTVWGHYSLQPVSDPATADTQQTATGGRKWGVAHEKRWMHSRYIGCTHEYHYWRVNALTAMGLKLVKDTTFPFAIFIFYLFQMSEFAVARLATCWGVGMLYRTHDDARNCQLQNVLITWNFSIFRCPARLMLRPPFWQGGRELPPCGCCVGGDTDRARSRGLYKTAASERCLWSWSD